MRATFLYWEVRPGCHPACPRLLPGSRPDFDRCAVV